MITRVSIRNTQPFAFRESIGPRLSFRIVGTTTPATPELAGDVILSHSGTHHLPNPGPMPPPKRCTCATPYVTQISNCSTHQPKSWVVSSRKCLEVMCFIKSKSKLRVCRKYCRRRSEIRARDTSMSQLPGGFSRRSCPLPSPPHRS